MSVNVDRDRRLAVSQDAGDHMDWNTRSQCEYGIRMPQVVQAAVLESQHRRYARARLRLLGTNDDSAVYGCCILVSRGPHSCGGRLDDCGSDLSGSVAFRARFAGRRWTGTVRRHNGCVGIRNDYGIHEPHTDEPAVSARTRSDVG